MDQNYSYTDSSTEESTTGNKTVSEMRFIRSICDGEINKTVVFLKHPDFICPTAELLADRNSSGDSEANVSKQATVTASKVTSIDIIVSQLRGEDTISKTKLLIIPSKTHKRFFKMHIIDHRTNAHLGAATITCEELFELQSKECRHQYFVIIGNKYVSLRTLASRSVFLGGLMNFHNPLKSAQKKEETSNKRLTGRKVSNKPSEIEMIEHKQEQYYNYCQLYRTTHEMRIASITERINTASVPSDEDLKKLFDMAESCFLKIYIRLEPTYIKKIESNNRYNINLEKDRARFLVEFFILFDRYIGGITLGTSKLKEQLENHPQLLPRVKFIKDVFELTPLPKLLIKVMHKLSNYFHWELLYERFGEFTFDLYIKSHMENYYRGREIICEKINPDADLVSHELPQL